MTLGSYLDFPYSYSKSGQKFVPIPQTHSILGSGRGLVSADDVLSDHFDLVEDGQTVASAQ